MTTPAPTPEQIEDAKELLHGWTAPIAMDEIGYVAAFLASRDAEHERVVAGIRMDFSVAKGAAISFRLRAEQAEAALAHAHEENEAYGHEFEYHRAALAVMTKERDLLLEHGKLAASTALSLSLKLAALKAQFPGRNEK